MSSKHIVTLVLMTLIFVSCHREMIVIPSESQKSIDGKWMVIKALRNGTDITNRFNFSNFKIAFQDSTFSIENPIPFVAQKGGTYHLDDPQYPFGLYIKENGGIENRIDLQYPISNGVRNIVISFSPGCASNTYQYTLQKIN